MSDNLTIPVFLVILVGFSLCFILLLNLKERREAASNISRAVAQYQSMFNNSHAVMLILNPIDGRIIDANPAAAAFYGWSLDTLKTMKISDINTLPGDKVKEVINAIASGQGYLFSFKHRKASGAVVSVEVHSSLIDFCGSEALFSIITDITAREAALRAMRESEERFRVLVDNAPDAVFVVVDQRFAFINHTGLRLLGASNEEELLGTLGANVIHPDYCNREAHAEEMCHRSSAAAPKEKVYIRLDQLPVSVESVSIPIRYNDTESLLIFARDITEKKALEQKNQAMEAQLRQQQKLEAIGTLAGGVAHEINNPLNGIMNYAQLILDCAEAESTAAEYSREIVHETERISVIVKNLLQFSRHDKQSHSYASIVDIIGQTTSLINTIIRKDNITLDIELEEDLPDIKCRSQQIQQVLMNLLTNARDSVNEKFKNTPDTKLIRVHCSQHQRDGRRWLLLTVFDNGVGIQEELRERIFEPFFSTKPKETGTGLGLSISYGIVKEHHGTITFSSKPGEFTVFTLELPVDNGWTL